LTGLTDFAVSDNPLTDLSPTTKQQLFAWYLKDNFYLDVSDKLYNELLRLKKLKTIKQLLTAAVQLLIAAVVLPVIFWLLFS
jgi:hypothetical protein